MDYNKLAADYAAHVRNLMSSKNAPVQIISSIVYPAFGCVLVKMKPAGVTTASKVLSLEADLRMSLGQKNVRLTDERDCMLADILYKQGRDIVHAPKLPIPKNPYEAILGIDVYGNVVTNDFTKEQESHLLVAGVTGSGKSAMVQAALASLTMKNTPETLQMFFVDSKGENPTWFIKYVRKFLTGIVITPQDTVKLINHAYNIMRDAQGKDIKIRHIVYIDELARLIAETDETTLNMIRAIASTGRSAGVHLIACTQNPIDRLVKDLPAQFNRRLVGRVQTNIQSKTATGFAGLGAEYLIGDGDFLSVKGGEVRRFQGAILPQHGKREAISQRVITMQEPNKVAPALPAPSAQVSQSVPSISLPAVDESASMRLQRANEFRRDLEINFLKFIFTHAPDIQTDAARARIMWPHLQKLEGGWQRRYDELKKEVIAQLQAK